MMDAHYETLMVKVTDGTATPAENEELMSWLVDHPESRRELEQQQALKAVTDGWVDRLEADLIADRQAASIPGQVFKRLGIGLVLAGFVCLMGFTFVETIGDPSAPLPIRLGFAGLVLGSLVLLGSVIHGRLQVRKKDRYKEVIR